MMGRFIILFVGWMLLAFCIDGQSVQLENGTFRLEISGEQDIDFHLPLALEQKEGALNFFNEIEGLSKRFRSPRNNRLFKISLTLASGQKAVNILGDGNLYFNSNSLREGEPMASFQLGGELKSDEPGIVYQLNGEYKVNVFFDIPQKKVTKISFYDSSKKSVRNESQLVVSPFEAGDKQIAKIPLINSGDTTASVLISTSTAFKKQGFVELDHPQKFTLKPDEVSYVNLKSTGKINEVKDTLNLFSKGDAQIFLRDQFGHQLAVKLNWPVPPALNSQKEEHEQKSGNFPWLIGLLLILLGVIAFIFLRRKRKEIISKKLLYHTAQDICYFTENHIYPPELERKIFEIRKKHGIDSNINGHIEKDKFKKPFGISASSRAAANVSAFLNDWLDEQLFEKGYDENILQLYRKVKKRQSAERWQKPKEVGPKKVATAEEKKGRDHLDKEEIIGQFLVDLMDGKTHFSEGIIGRIELLKKQLVEEGIQSRLNEVSRRNGTELEALSKAKSWQQVESMINRLHYKNTELNEYAVDVQRILNIPLETSERNKALAKYQKLEDLIKEMRRKSSGLVD